MPQFDMKRVEPPFPAGVEVLVASEPGPVLRGAGDLTYRCGACKSKLLENVEHHQVCHVVVQCRKCGKHNEIPDAHHHH